MGNGEKGELEMGRRSWGSPADRLAERHPHMADEPKPEERARVKIDEQLVDAGWHIADRSHFT